MKSLLMLLLVLNFGMESKPTQIFNTSLTVTVRDETGNIVEGVSIKLFLKEEDYTKEVNVLAEGTTDKKGVFRFKELDPKSYFILCRKGDKDNTGGGEKVSTLEKGKYNKITVIIE